MMYKVGPASWLLAIGLLVCYVFADAPADKNLKLCGADAYYDPAKYTCYDGGFLCPVISGSPTLRCGDACYLPASYSCVNGRLVQASSSTAGGGSSNASSSSVKSSSTAIPTVPGNAAPACPSSSVPVTQFIANPPYSNYFLSTCHTNVHVLVTSPLSSSNLTLIGPRLIAAFPGGNSGIAAFWIPQNRQNGTLGIKLLEQDGERNLTEVYIPADAYKARFGGGGSLPAVGASGLLDFNSSAALTVPILGGVRTIRDFTEGPSLLVPEIQDAIQLKQSDNGSIILSREWLDNSTVTTLGFSPASAGAKLSIGKNKTVLFQPGSYVFWTAYDYPQLTQLEASEVLNPSSQGLIQQQPDLTTSLSFLSYSEKLLAGTWRFLTYFGRDSMIAALLLQPVLSDGPNSAMEAVIGAVLERINRTDGSVCHEETLGDYATYLNRKMNVTSNDPLYTYPMIDVDYYLPVLMQRYFLQGDETGMTRAKALLSTPAGSTNPANKNLTWADLANINAQKIMVIAERFAANGNQTKDNLAHLKADQIVGQWRDSTYGIGGGRIPYDVNTALMPAALHSISALTAAGIYQGHSDWTDLAKRYAQVWEDQTLDFFSVKIPAATAKQRLSAYVQKVSFGGPNMSSLLDDANGGRQDVVFHAIALDGYDNLTQVQVMHTDDCFRLFLLDGATNETQHTAFLNQSALNVARTFPAGLLSDVGLLVANPAYGAEPVYAENFTTSAYHGTVVWSWQMAMMAKGFEVQLLRCSEGGTAGAVPAFCRNTAVMSNVLTAYNKLWDVIERNKEHLSSEVWSWRYEDGRFNFVELGDLPPPPGTSPTGKS